MTETLEHPMEVDILIKNGLIITMDRLKNILYDGALAIDNGRIVALGPMDQLAGMYVGKKTINACHRAVLPGLIDTHHHFLQNFLKSCRYRPIINPHKLKKGESDNENRSTE